MCRRNGWYEEVKKYLFFAIAVITKEDVFRESKKYNRRVDFQRKSPSYYAKALNNGWLDKCCSHMMTANEAFQQSRSLTCRWTKESIMEEIKKYKKYNELSKMGGLKKAIKKFKYKAMPIPTDRHTHIRLAAKIRDEYYKKCR